jgi:hypothetical protein
MVTDGNPLDPTKGLPADSRPAQYRAYSGVLQLAYDLLVDDALANSITQDNAYIVAIRYGLNLDETNKFIEVITFVKGNSSITLQQLRKKLQAMY